MREVDRELEFSHVLPLGDTRAELLLIGRTILNSAERHRDLRKIIRREGRHLKKISAIGSSAMREDAFKDLLPWLEEKLRASGREDDDPKALAVSVFGPVFFVLYAEDQGDEPLDVARDRFLNHWSARWASQLDHKTVWESV